MMTLCKVTSASCAQMTEPGPSTLLSSKVTLTAVREALGPTRVMGLQFWNTRFSSTTLAPLYTPEKEDVVYRLQMQCVGVAYIKRRSAAYNGCTSALLMSGSNGLLLVAVMTVSPRTRDVQHVRNRRLTRCLLSLARSPWSLPT